MPKVLCTCGAKTEVPNAYLNRAIRCPTCRSEFIATLERKPVPSTVAPITSSDDHSTQNMSQRFERLLPNRMAKIGAVTGAVCIVVFVVTMYVSGLGASRKLAEQQRRSKEIQEETLNRARQDVADLERKAALARGQSLQQPAFGQSEQRQPTVDELIAADPMISRLSRNSTLMGIKLRRGEYPSDEIDLMIMDGRMSASSAQHVREFCDSVRNRVQ